MDTKIGNLTVPPDFVFPEMVEDVSEHLKRLVFPGGFSCYTHTATNETALIYNEIIIKQEYFQHGLSAVGARCVLDVGANVGIFTMAAKLAAPEATVYAFEPIPDTFEVLERNVQSLGCKDVYTYNVAIGSQDHSEQEFTFFPHMPGNSTANPALKESNKPVMDQLFGKEESDFLHLTASRVVQVRTLSAVIQEQGITSIDFLKIDVEGAELSVLEGIAETHWPMIRQVAMETHTEPLRAQAYERLSGLGFEVYTDLGLSSPIGVSALYARRP